MCWLVGRKRTMEWYCMKLLISSPTISYWLVALCYSSAISYWTLISMRMKMHWSISNYILSHVKFLLVLLLTLWCIGGAERLIVDAAVELASHGHKVHVFTAHHDKNRCFEETLSGENWLFFGLWVCKLARMGQSFNFSWFDKVDVFIVKLMLLYSSFTPFFIQLLGRFPFFRGWILYSSLRFPP